MSEMNQLNRNHEQQRSLSVDFERTSTIEENRQEVSLVTSLRCHFCWVSVVAKEIERDGWDKVPRVIWHVLTLCSSEEKSRSTFYCDHRREETFSLDQEEMDSTYIGVMWTISCVMKDAQKEG